MKKWSLSSELRLPDFRDISLRDWKLIEVCWISGKGLDMPNRVQIMFAGGLCGIVYFSREEDAQRVFDRFKKVQRRSDMRIEKTWCLVFLHRHIGFELERKSAIEDRKPINVLFPRDLAGRHFVKDFTWGCHGIDDV